jgi:hypothetical protein
MKKRDIKNLIIIYVIIILIFWVVLLKQENKKELKIFNQEKSYLITEVIEAKKLAVLIYNENKDYIAMLQETRNSLNDELDMVKSMQNDKTYLENLLKDLRSINGVKNKRFTLLLCISENDSLDYNTSHQGLYENVCGVNPYLWSNYLNNIGVEVNSLTAGFKVYKFYLRKNKGNKKKALLDFKGVDKNEKVKKVVDKIIEIEKELK